MAQMFFQLLHIALRCRHGDYIEAGMELSSSTRQHVSKRVSKHDPRPSDAMVAQCCMRLCTWFFTNYTAAAELLEAKPVHADLQPERNVQTVGKAKEYTAGAVLCMLTQPPAYKLSSSIRQAMMTQASEMMRGCRIETSFYGSPARRYSLHHADTVASGRPPKVFSPL